MGNYEMPSKSKMLLVEFWHFDEKTTPFIIGVSGPITIDVISEIEKEVEEDCECMFEKGLGHYLFKAYYEKGEYSPIDGRCENAPYWGLDFLYFEPMELDS